MLDSEHAAPFPLQASESDHTRGRSSAPPGSESSTFLVLSIREDDGACIATVICAGFASVLRFVLDRHDEWTLGTASDEWPVEPGSDEYWDCLGLVNDYMGGTQAERRQLNARLAGAYLAAREAA